MSRFYRECFCSLLAVRPHPVTSRADWKRHRDVREQDRIAELFAERSPSPEPEMETDPIVYTLDDMEYIEDKMEDIEDGDYNSEEDAVVNDDLEVVEDELELVEDQVEYDHDMLDYLTDAQDDGGNEDATQTVRKRFQDGAAQYDDEQQALSGDGEGEKLGELDDYREELEDYSQDIHTDQPTVYHKDGREIVAEYQDELLSDTESEESNCPPSEGVGQMQRGFVSPVENELDTNSDPEDLDSSSSSSNSGTDAEDNAFPYGQIKCALKEEEILSIAIHHLKLSHRISRAASTDFTRLIENFTDVSCWDYRTTRKWIASQTGIQPVIYDCCRNSCMSFAMYPDKDICDHYESPRWRALGGGPRAPFATYEYIPVIHRLILWYANPRRAAKLVSYRRRAEQSDKYTDYWSSELFKDQKKKHLFDASTDLGFLLTTDGVQVFKAKSRFSIWPIVLACLNLPPEIRTKRQNLLCVGFIPGPKGPKNLDSFLYPMVKEFERLQDGIPEVLNASISSSLPTSDRYFCLRAHICLVGADMVAREKIMKVTGNRSYCYCEYCMIQGVWNKALYCPISPPTDAPRNAKGYPWPKWDRQNLPMRNNQEFRLVAHQIATRGATEKQKSKYGVKGLSILGVLKSIDFPRSFPPDSMHLWFENVIPDMVKHWRGKYKVDGVAEQDDDGFQNDGAQRAAPARPTVPAPGPPGRRKVIATDDPYNISLADWELISKEIALSGSTFPSIFGPNLRNFIEHIHELTAAEWQLFTFTLGPVYLKGVLADEDYTQFISLIEAIQICCDYELTEEDIEDVRQRIERFSIYYENRYYREEWARLKGCLPVFHQILHVSQALKWAGPMYVYSQWAMERFCGTLSGMAKSRVSTNKNLANSLAMMEQKSALVYVLPTSEDIDQAGPDYGSSDEDGDGNIKLASFLTKRLKKSLPPNIAPRSFNGDVICFSGPCKRHTLTPHERIRLKALLTDEELMPELVSETQAGVLSDDLDIPTQCMKFNSVAFFRRSVYDFKSTCASSNMTDVNQTRSTSFVRFEKSGQSHFAEVQFYFIVELDIEGWYGGSEREPIHQAGGALGLKVRENSKGAGGLAGARDARRNELLLAYIRHFPVCQDGQLLYRQAGHVNGVTGGGVLRVIHASSIQELVGLLKKGRREYIVRKGGTLF